MATGKHGKEKSFAKKAGALLLSIVMGAEAMFGFYISAEAKPDERGSTATKTYDQYDLDGDGKNETIKLVREKEEDGGVIPFVYVNGKKYDMDDSMGANAWVNSVELLKVSGNTIIFQVEKMDWTMGYVVVNMKYKYKNGNLGRSSGAYKVSYVEKANTGSGSYWKKDHYLTVGDKFGSYTGATLYSDKKCKNEKGVIKNGKECKIIKIYLYKEKGSSSLEESIYVKTKDGKKGWLRTGYEDGAAEFSDTYTAG